jgi:uncharacterized protein YeaO (DUF488 family)
MGRSTTPSRSTRVPAVEVQRIYEARAASGYRVLVDRLWPRGIRKEDAGLDEWCKDVAPSTELRRWYGHAPERFHEFARRYREELRRPPASEALAHLRAAARGRRIVLLTATRDVDRSGARVLRDRLAGRATR